jgi:hypothetical protein
LSLAACQLGLELRVRELDFVWGVAASAGVSGVAERSEALDQKEKDKEQEGPGKIRNI